MLGETLKFPTTTEEVQALLKRIGVDGVRYEKFFITSFDGDVLGLYDYLTEYENLDEMCIRDRLYARFGITDTTDYSTKKPTDFPVMSDFYDLCEEEYMLSLIHI